MLFRFEAQNLKDLRLSYASEHSNFKPHDDIGEIKTSKEYNSLHVSTFRDNTHIPVKFPRSKPNAEPPFDSNPPMNELRFLDGYSGEKRFCMKK